MNGLRGLAARLRSRPDHEPSPDVEEWLDDLRAALTQPTGELAERLRIRPRREAAR
ncbi:hypothetical protein QTQ03_16555 [Micromonospora sp. WMMA1363]|uniref:hypothetical protein n=1 Tax=Micromonospora sp. WMMA1363 TaxID=3053985 RepID=UPI00259CF595|nr:hypothetical protein [Micromonospora sp. WMMA1363]MDM4721130.1 hypothetical protein [Micromonospora sp. WMMA1363]